MILVFVTMDNEGHCRPFSYQVPRLENAFDVLSLTIATGRSLVSVELIDSKTGHRTSLPPDAFDGQPIRAHIDQLEKEWQAVLAVPAPSAPLPDQLLATYSVKLYETYQTRIRCLELAIQDIDARYQQVPPTAYWESSHIRLAMQLTQYRGQLERAQAGQRRIRHRFAPYLDNI